MKPGFLHLHRIVLASLFIALFFTQANAQVDQQRWKKFTAVYKGEEVKLSWVVASEVNNPIFYIEHNHGTGVWDIIGIVKGKSDLGTLAKEEFVHANPGSGMHQYRIRQESAAGKSTFSDVTAVNIKPDGNLATSTWPNPARNVVNIQTSDDKAKAGIFDLSGKPVKQVALNAGNNPVDIRSLKPAVYFLRIESNNGNHTLQKIIKQ
jgi:hypothetical protein